MFLWAQQFIQQGDNLVRNVWKYSLSFCQILERGYIIVIEYLKMHAQPHVHHILYNYDKQSWSHTESVLIGWSDR